MSNDNKEVDPREPIVTVEGDSHSVVIRKTTPDLSEPLADLATVKKQGRHGYAATARLTQATDDPVVEAAKSGQSISARLVARHTVTSSPPEATEAQKRGKMGDAAIKIAKEHAAGTLDTPEAYARLEAAGIPKEQVDDYLGVVAEGQAAPAPTPTTLPEPGSNAELRAALAWANNVLSPADVTAWNEGMDDPTRRDELIAQLRRVYRFQNTPEPGRSAPAPMTPAASVEAQTLAAMTPAMLAEYIRNPLYHDKTSRGRAYRETLGLA